MILDPLPWFKMQHCLGGRGWTVDGALEAYIWTKGRSASGPLAVQASPPWGGPSYSKLRLSLLASIWLGGIAMLAPDAVRAQQGPFVYVPNAGNNNVSVIDTPTNTTVPPTMALPSDKGAASGSTSSSHLLALAIKGQQPKATLVPSMIRSLGKLAIFPKCVGRLQRTMSHGPTAMAGTLSRLPRPARRNRRLSRSRHCATTALSSIAIALVARRAPVGSGQPRARHGDFDGFPGTSGPGPARRNLNVPHAW
jgi:hypothetical protein